ncbi:MAG: type IX secretion system sortase PorU [Muribaculaceae bacterium]|nr:type IX secretion system sortase PorU [Muribaculaceae bacterium]
MKISAYILALISIITGSLSSFALDASHYSSSSVLSEGRWQRIKVNSTGMHLVTNADLKSMGFTDASKVRVYGTGGRVLPEALNADMPDDLPLLRSVVTPKGILFFGTDNVSWNPKKAYGERHTLNPYCAESYYFLSDRATDEFPQLPATSSSTKSSNILTHFEERSAYERDLAAPGDMGRMIFGEDFRTNKAQTFTFSLPGLVGSTAIAAVRFGARTTSGGSQIAVSANGKALPATNADKIPASGEEFIKHTTTIKEIFDLESEKLALTIDFSYSGALFTARLDYIEVFYERALKMGSDSQLHFYGQYNGGTIALEGCSSETVIWDVTDPCNAIPVEYTLEGSTAYFTPFNGYKEFVAFNPASCSRSVSRAGIVRNQNIHGLDTPDMVIVCPEEYNAAAERIAQLHRDYDGFNVEVLNLQQIFNEFSGGHNDVSAIRKLLKMWHDRPGDRKIGYCLLLGKGIYDYKLVASGARNTGYTPIPMWQSPTGLTEISAFSTDDYIGMLADCTEDSFNMNSAQMQVAVGRIPVRSAAQALEIAQKIENYVKTPTYGPWRNRVMLIADDQDEGLHLRQTEDVWKRLSANAPHYQYEKLYLDSYPLEQTSLGNTYPKAKERMMRLFNEGVIYTNYIGHASTTSWTHEKLLQWSDIVSFTNPNLPFFIAATCSFGHWDTDEMSGAETLVLNPTAGFISAIVPSRTVFMPNNGVLSGYMADNVLTTASDGGGTRFGDVFINAKNKYRDDNKLRYCMIGDPALRLPKAERTVNIETLNGIDLAAATELPQIPALGKAEVSGTVTNLDGSEAADFSGTIMLDLYDAETVVETYGNGKAGSVETYNDRKSKLSSVSAKVIDGKWSATLLLPAEIANNTSPARIVAYAWTEQGTEASGSTESLCVAGYPEEDSHDTEGPAITELYINYPSFSNGDMVNSNPVLHASFYDESGINISESGIGHKMSVTLDDDIVFDDVYTYYTTDPENPLGGHVSYPLQDLKAGKHSLKFTVYDNANNPSAKTVTFDVAEVKGPSIRDLYTDVNPASTSVVISVSVDNPNTLIKCLIEVFDLSGKCVWSSDRSATSDMSGTINTTWDLRDTAGHRVHRGIYLYRARVETADGQHCTKTKKLAVTAQ